MKVALISLDYYGYDKYIVSTMKKLGIEAIHVDIYANRYKYPNLGARLINLINKTFFNSNIKRKHLDKIIHQELSDIGIFDKIIIIHAEWLSPETLLFCKKISKQMIAYHYDGVQRMPAISSTFNYFDKIYSYDKKDVEKYNLEFIPNFIYEEHIKEKKSTLQKAFNISSLDQRTPVLEKIAKVLEEKNYPYEFIVVNRRQLNFYIPTIKTKIQYSNHMISREISLDKMKNSSIIIDIQRPEQVGLTFRVFEALGYRKKLITTNKDIVNYDFYNPNNILLLDLENIEIPESFLKSEYQEIPQEIFSKYQIENWVKKILEIH